MPTEIKQANMLKEIISNRKLIWDLSKNDFKTRFAGSYLGIIWAFVQPIVTVLVYWFVFEKGMHASGINLRSGITAPFVLWLIAGLVPWFFFQEVLSGGTNAVIKVVFQIDILPIIKLISALFVHLFFIAFTIILYACYGYYPDLYTLQMLYYTFAMMILLLGLIYATSAIVVFFKDLGQIINIILQIGVWMTPIMWNIDGMELNPILITILKLNPMYKAGFWEQPGMTIYYWILTIVLFIIGTKIFKKLKPHFADVL